MTVIQLILLPFFMYLLDSEYDVEFKTAADENAGTDANVFFQMIGEDGESQEIELKNTEKGYFHRGKLDRFRVRAKDVGRVRTSANQCSVCPPLPKTFGYCLFLSFPFPNTNRFLSPATDSNVSPLGTLRVTLSEFCSVV